MVVSSTFGTYSCLSVSLKHDWAQGMAQTSVGRRRCFIRRFRVGLSFSNMKIATESTQDLLYACPYRDMHV